MPIFTDKHCLICYKEVCMPHPATTAFDPSIKNGLSSTSTSSETSMDFASNSKALNKNSEICRRFCTLASRHYELEDPAFQKEKTLNSKWMVNMDRACDSCTEMLSSFCDIYYQIQYLQLQLECRGSEILEVMEEADNENSNEYAPHKKTLEEEMKKYDMSLDEIDDFRGELKYCITERRKKLYPRVKLKREKTGEEEDEDDLFTLIPPKKKLKSKSPSDQKESEEGGVSKDQPLQQSASAVTKENPLLEQTTSPKIRSRRASANSVHSNNTNYSSSDSDDLFTRVVTVKKNKRAAKKISPDRTNNNNNSNDDENKRMIMPRPDLGFQTRSSSNEDINQAEVPSNWHEEGW